LPPAHGLRGGREATRPRAPPGPRGFFWWGGGGGGAVSLGSARSIGSWREPDGTVCRNCLIINGFSRRFSLKSLDTSSRLYLYLKAWGRRVSPAPAPHFEGRSLRWMRSCNHSSTSASIHPTLDRPSCTLRGNSPACSSLAMCCGE